MGRYDVLGGRRHGMPWLMRLVRVGLAILPLLLAPTLRAEASGIAGPDQTMAEGLIVLLGDPTTSGTGRGSDTWRWRQIQPASPLVKLSHIDYPNTMFVAPAVSQSTTFQFELNKNSGQSIATVNITVVPLGADTPANTTFIDRTLAAPCTTYDPTTRLCGSGTYTAMKEVFSATNQFNPTPAPGRRYVFRGGTYPYFKNWPGNGVDCWPVATPLVNVSGANGTASQPIVFKAYKDPATGNYETPVLDASVTDTGALNACETEAIFWVHGSSYIIIEGFTATGATVGSDKGFYLGGSGFGSGGIGYSAEPVHHVTVRHSIASHNGSSNSFKGAFYTPGPSHEVLLEYIESFDNGTGIEFSIPHQTDRTLQPYNTWTQYASVHDNFRGGGNSGGIGPNARNSIVSHMVNYRNSDGGGGTQGPEVNDSVLEYLVTYGHDAALSQVAGGNERGIQIGNINPTLAQTSPFYAGGRNTLSHHIVAFDNHGNGINDAQGSHNGQYYHVIAFNNGLTISNYAWAGIGLESEGGHMVNGQLYYPTVTIAATMRNSIAYHSCGGIPDLANVQGRNTVSNTLVNSNPYFVVATPSLCSASSLTVDTALYTNAAQRIPNPHFHIVDGLKLQAGSPAIDAGVLVPGFHCARADDNPTSPYATNDPNCVHWNGAAPDIGAYEFGSQSQLGSPPPAPSSLKVQ